MVEGMNQNEITTVELEDDDDFPVVPERSGTSAHSKNGQCIQVEAYLVSEDGSLVSVGSTDSHSTNNTEEVAAPDVTEESFPNSKNNTNFAKKTNEDDLGIIRKPPKRNLLTTLVMSNKKSKLADSDIESSSTLSVNDAINLDPTNTPSGKQRQLKQSRKITKYIDVLRENEDEKIDLALAKFIFGCNLPFRVVESPLFKNFIRTIRPAYVDHIPGRKKLSTTLLQTCYKECLDSARKEVKSDSVILCNGWKNSSSNTKTVVTMLHSTDGESGFIDAWDLTTESETAEKLAEIIIQSREIAKEKYNVDVYAVVSDNASAMVKMGSLLKHCLWHSTCNSHTGNLLAKDILDKKLLENVVLVLKEFKQPDFEKMILDEGGRRIKLPVETRWCSYRNSFKSFLENLDYMKKIIAATRKKIKPKVTELIFKDDFADTKSNL
ncbi:uncharacterized protein LOC126744161 [Anthonomus grandis grandis]|uniref:uncharacterized protein LOC126744161 n=1 Tax=Anthonomus grandis grandis TaxID=2921223 RepID=UPI002166BB93|nr:uncharacterized protein LOC126744161 [Anthonomus grandis grandis]